MYELYYVLLKTELNVRITLLHFIKKLLLLLLLAIGGVSCKRIKGLNGNKVLFIRNL